jgi:hypothetical protein
MISRNQPDLFGAGETADEDAPTVYYHGDPDRVRARIGRLIAEARAAETMPWNEDDVRFWRKVVPQMARWLPAVEAARLCSEFDEEVRRLQPA